MTSPHATAAGAVAGSIIASPAGLYGADPVALILGLIAATLVSFGMSEISSKPRAASAVCLAGLLAGFGSPTALASISSAYPILALTESAVPLLGILIGALSPSLVPLIIAAAQRWLGRIAP